MISVTSSERSSAAKRFRRQDKPSGEGFWLVDVISTEPGAVGGLLMVQGSMVDRTVAVIVVETCKPGSARRERLVLLRLGLVVSFASNKELN
jgi:hypothetical protein